MLCRALCLTVDLGANTIYDNREELTNALRSLILSDYDGNESGSTRYASEPGFGAADELEDFCNRHTGFTLDGYEASALLQDIVDDKKLESLELQPALNALSSRSLFTTSDGSIRLGREEIVDGDTIVVFEGCNMPIALRGCDGGFRFMGCCFVHGIMNGELLHEDLPWTPITFC